MSSNGFVLGETTTKTEKKSLLKLSSSESLAQKNQENDASSFLFRCYYVSMFCPLRSLYLKYTFFVSRNVLID